ncbi:MAG: glycerol kinase [Deltaproteobacteria bacterium]|nr:MAG: glycerol kinase [Deltaproteobacteria bacterium]
MKHVISIDQGTTGTTVLILDETLRVVARGYREFRQIYPQPGWVEHDPNDIWESVTGALADALGQASLSRDAIAAIGITNQRETTLLWDRATGEPVRTAIVWQDRRTADLCADLKAAGHEQRVRATTGLVLDPYFSGTKLKWMLDQDADLRARAARGDLAFGTVDSYLVYRLTGGAHVTDVSNASRTLLFGLESLAWDDDMLALFDVPRAVLPEVRGSAEVYGHTRGVPGVPDGVPVSGMAGDQQAALFGQACVSPGDAKCTYGTGAFILMNTGGQPVASRHGLLTTVAWKVADEVAYALEGSAFIAGAAVQWLRDGLGLIERAADIEALAASVPDSGGVVVVPAFAGLGAPHWRPDARGLITGLTRGTTAAHIARATLEGIALQNYDILQAMQQDSGRTLTSLKVDGGAAANDLLMQFQADVLGVRIARPEILETTALGAAFLAGIGAGVWRDAAQVAGVWRQQRAFEPTPDRAAIDAHLARWNAAVAKA